MTAEQAAQNLGVSVETLVQEVIAEQLAGSILMTALLVAILLGAIVEYWDVAVVTFTVACIVLLGFVLSCSVLIDWCAAPETTAREYIVDNYGGSTE